MNTSVGDHLPFHARRTGEDALARLDPVSGRSALDEPARGGSAGPGPTWSSYLPPILFDDLPERLHALQRTVSTVS
ncbi:hypothetical protein ACTWPT_26420 [Nonomuraea sp. 3N208]|uniref:hypothetical protein n=1 Tax=Nonomuraea sp. 3N208 TaxID=3457421 RepID=UPI003FD4356B